MYGQKFMIFIPQSLSIQQELAKVVNYNIEDHEESFQSIRLRSCLEHRRTSYGGPTVMDCARVFMGSRGPSSLSLGPNIVEVEGFKMVGL